MERLIQLIKKLMDTKFYGELIIKLEAGKVVHIKKTESIKVDNDG